MVLIDLGEDRSSGYVVERGPQIRPKWTTWLPLLALLPVLLLTSAAPPPAAPFTVLADQPAGASYEITAVTEDVLVMRGPEKFSVHGFDGRVRWEHPWPLRSALWVTGRKLVAQRLPSLDQRTTAFDVVTGELLWELKGAATPVGDVVVASGPEAGLSVYDETGRSLLWEAPKAIKHAVTATGTVLTLDGQGILSERELRTGEVTGSTTLTLPPSQILFMNAERGVITLYSRGADAMEGNVTKLDRTTFAVLSAGKELPMFDQSPVTYECGPVRCELDPARMQVMIVDAGSGAPIWWSTSGRGILNTPAGLLDYSLVNSTADLGERMHLVDPVSGRRIAEIKGWHKIINNNQAGTIAGGQGEQPLSIAPVLVRMVHTEGTEGNTFLAGFSPTGLKVLGSVPQIFARCHHRSWRLVCLSTGDHLVVVQLHPERW